MRIAGQAVGYFNCKRDELAEQNWPQLGVSLRNKPSLAGISDSRSPRYADTGGKECGITERQHYPVSYLLQAR